MGLYRRGPSWYFECEIDGQRYRKRIGRDLPRKVAQDIASKIRGEIVAGNFGLVSAKQRKDPSFDEARARFEEWVRSTKKAETIDTYCECLRRLGESFGTKKLSEISPFLVEKHRLRRIQDGVRVRVNRELAVLRNLYNRCREWKLYLGDNPCLSVKMGKEPRQRLRFLEFSEENCLLSVCSEPLRTMILVALHTGVRLKSEGLSLRWQSVDLHRRTITVESAFSKNSRPRTIPLNSVVFEALSQLPRTSEWVFTKPGGKPYTAVRGFKEACDKAGLVDVVPHTLRHTFATRLIANGVDLRTVQELGGWSNLKMLERYGHVSPGRKAAAVEGLLQKSPSESPAQERMKLVTT